MKGSKIILSAGIIALLIPRLLIAIEPLPAVPYPAENPPSEAKRILGKILFWDEQLSTDNSIACGSCHLPSANGADKRIGLEPGFDKKLNTPDDILGSLGVVARNKLGEPVKHTVFKHNPQVTNRSAQSFFSGLWAEHNFWDGRAGPEFIDPRSNQIAIFSGGALENQALGPLMSSTEMAKKGQTSKEVIAKLSQAKPLALASNLPKDIDLALANEPSYTELFAKAFGDNQISLKRIAFAIATYERSLVADKTPWDIANSGQHKLPYLENLGWEFFQQSGCEQCHKPPLFTDNKFYNIGIQGGNTDAGRKQISLQQIDLGAMKVPSLRNTGLKITYMHTGQFTTLEQVIDAYADVPFEDMATKMPNGDDYNFQFTEYQRKALVAFLKNSLTDKRVKEASFPFDRPKLRSEIKEFLQPIGVKNLKVSVNADNLVEISWEDFTQQHTGFDLEIVRNDGRHYWATQSPFQDINTETGQSYQYQVFTRNAQLQRSTSTTLHVTVAHNFSWLALIIILLASIILVMIKRRN
ncbi:cytochrome-c peroxidase [Paraglaciecola sp.]|uniref:cytochrome-c peroxidase n=1 Tax=Paraglaciecola sp. TaxID=1920173 RepID=UPI003EF951DD